MPKKRTLTAVLLALSLLAGCAQPTAAMPPPAAEPTATAEPSVYLQDYDSFWQTLRENYPHYAVAERIAGRPLEEMYRQYRPQAEKVTSAAALADLLRKSIKSFEYCGHLSLIDRSGYHSLLQTYGRTAAQDDPKCQYLYDKLTTPAVLAYYKMDRAALAAAKASGFAQEPAPTSVAEQTGDAPENLTVTEKLEEGYFVLKIAQMTSEWENDDRVRLAAAFTKMEEAGVANCILDIRGNGGGDSRYWSEGIVDPNLIAPAQEKSYMLVDGALCADYLALSCGADAIQPIASLPTEELPALPQQDLAHATAYIEHTARYQKAEKPLYTGKFWLLVDEAVYSSSEKLAVFCKQTGFATLVGTPTGGDAGVDPLILSLLNTGIAYRFSACEGLNPDGASNEEFGTAPDIAVSSGRDAMRACLAAIEASTD